MNDMRIVEEACVESDSIYDIATPALDAFARIKAELSEAREALHAIVLRRDAEGSVHSWLKISVCADEMRQIARDFFARHPEEPH